MTVDSDSSPRDQDPWALRVISLKACGFVERVSLAVFVNLLRGLALTDHDPGIKIPGFSMGLRVCCCCQFVLVIVPQSL